MSCNDEGTHTLVDSVRLLRCSELCWLQSEQSVVYCLWGHQLGQPAQCQVPVATVRVEVGGEVSWSGIARTLFTLPISSGSPGAQEERQGEGMRSSPRWLAGGPAHLNVEE